MRTGHQCSNRFMSGGRKSATGIFDLRDQFQARSAAGHAKDAAAAERGELLREGFKGHAGQT